MGVYHIHKTTIEIDLKSYEPTVNNYVELDHVTVQKCIYHLSCILDFKSLTDLYQWCLINKVFFLGKYNHWGTQEKNSDILKTYL